jgi:uncharacterized protein (TIGR02594 family)
MVQEPRWLQIARSYVGVREVPGAKHNGTILGWLSRLKAWWKDDETPWCGVFVAECMRQAGITDLPKTWMRASSWGLWGANLRTTHVAPGAILVFTRRGGGHVGFYVGEDKLFYYVLGGNQNNMVNVAKIAKARCTAVRWPRGEPVVGGPVNMVGGVVSDTEA